MKFMEIDKSYWQDKKPIPVNPEEKKEHLKQEIDMFRETCKTYLLPCSDWCVSNLLVESLAIHARILVDFFYNDFFLSEKKKSDRRDINDIIAQDFIIREDWIKIRPPITQILYDAREKANKQLAHLSAWRVKLDKDEKKSWDRGIQQDIENVIKIFEKAAGIKFQQV